MSCGEFQHQPHKMKFISQRTCEVVQMELLLPSTALLSFSSARQRLRKSMKKMYLKKLLKRKQNNYDKKDNI